MNKRKFMMLSALLTSIFLLLALSGCSIVASNDIKEDKVSDGSLARIKQQGAIHIGSSPTGPPFTFLNVDTNQIDGLMADIAKEVGKRLNLKSDVQSIAFASLIPSLQSGKIDMISAGMAITDERKQAIDFSDPVYSYGEVVAIPKGNTIIKNLEDLKGKKIGAQAGTIYVKGLENLGLTVQTYKSIGDMVTELGNGRIDAFVGDYPIVSKMINDNPKFDVQVVQGYKPIWVSDIGMGFKKGDMEFRDQVNTIFKQMKQSGDIDNLIKKWIK